MSVDQTDVSDAEVRPAATSRGESRLRVDVVDGEVDLAALLEWATTPGTGAVVSFTGVVRDHSPEMEHVVAIDYDVYESGTRARLQEIGHRALDAFDGIGRVALVHRQGHVALGGGSVWVVVSAAHRAAAFDAASYCIDVLKETVPVWKRETDEDGATVFSSGTPVVEIPTAHDRWFDARDQRRP